MNVIQYLFSVAVTTQVPDPSKIPTEYGLDGYLAIFIVAGMMAIVMAGGGFFFKHLVNQNKEMKQQNENLQKTLGEQKDAISAIGAQMSSLTSTVSSIKSELNTTIATINDSVRTQMDRLIDTTSDNKSMMTEIKMRQESFMTNLERYANAVAEVNVRLDRVDRQQALVEDKLRGIHDNTKSVRDRLDAAARKSH